jgi:hypothetical protein
MLRRRQSHASNDWPLAQDPPLHYSANDLYLRVQDLDKVLRVRGYSVLRITGATLLLLAFYTYLFKEVRGVLVWGVFLPFPE